MGFSAERAARRLGSCAKCQPLWTDDRVVLQIRDARGNVPDGQRRFPETPGQPIRTLLDVDIGRHRRSAGGRCGLHHHDRAGTMTLKLLVQNRGVGEITRMDLYGYRPAGCRIYRPGSRPLPATSRGPHHSHCRVDLVRCALRRRPAGQLVTLFHGGGDPGVRWRSAAGRSRTTRDGHLPWAYRPRAGTPPETCSTRCRRPHRHRHEDWQTGLVQLHDNRMRPPDSDAGWLWVRRRSH